MLSKRACLHGGLLAAPRRQRTARRFCNGPQSINEKVLELGFEEAVTEIWSVDSQYSAENGVIVQVTGCQQCKARPGPARTPGPRPRRQPGVCRTHRLPLSAPARRRSASAGAGAGGGRRGLTGARAARAPQDKPRRSFVQTFFLATQDKGFFVLNDLFRYLPEPQAAQPPAQAAAPAPPAAAEGYGFDAPAGGAPLQAPHLQARPRPRGCL